ncbi:MAG: GntR family transcriptional regulator [Proteobacteria bacterium]|nr:GntR family transcriptional regulator [Pseudomonadota bacterium]MBI3497311.1 GntR family transcriptional regulator [Pseudomonadota bacterium]
MLDLSETSASVGAGRQSDIAFEMLKADIIACRIPPGASISETELASRYQLGKAAIRAALMRLGAGDWLTAIARRGYQVKPVTLRDIAEIFDLHRVLGPSAARLAAGRCATDRIEPLDAVCGAGFLPGDASSEATFMRAHRQLHLAIALGTGNRRLARSFEQLWDETERVIHHAGLLRARGAELRHDHRSLIAAIARGDGEEAAAAVLEEVEQLYRSLVEVALKTASPLTPSAAATDKGEALRW